MSSVPPLFRLNHVPAGRWLVGHLWEFKQRPLDVMAAWREQHGDLVQFRLGTRSCYLISHPDLAEEVLLHKPDDFAKIYDPKKPSGLGLVLGNGLLTSEGPLWRKNRRLMQPAFQRQRVTAMAPDIAAAGEGLLKRWDELDDRRPVDISVEMMKVTLDVITRTMLGSSLLDEVDRLAPALDTLIRYAFRSFHNPFRVPLWVPTPGNRAFQHAKASVDELIYGVIRERRAGGIRRDDLLDQLLYAVDQDTGVGLTDEQLRDELLTIAAAGHETTANGLSWAWYLLATHRDMRARLHDELARVLEGRLPVIEDLSRLVYTRSVFEETLRLYPPAPALQRKAIRETSLGGCSIRAGSLIIISLWNIHRHPDLWKDPEAFRPERFTAEADAARHRLAWMPFGAGHRTCIGNHFAMIEGPLLLALIAQRYEMDLPPGQTVEPEVAVTVRPKHGLQMTIRRRNESAGYTKQVTSATSQGA
ncbi:MAG TPA: cytochrome P450 [Nitrospiraceae bacterium]|nr:cytochrome P450 [Nitrospiraceae bacterium]